MDIGTQIMTVVGKIAKRRKLSEDVEADACGIAWVRYQQSPQHGVVAHCRYAVLYAIAGRPLPEGPERRRGPAKPKAIVVHAGHAIAWLATARPDGRVLAEEMLAALKRRLNRRSCVVLDTLLAGGSVRDCAAEVAVSYAYAYQLREELRERVAAFMDDWKED